MHVKRSFRLLGVLMTIALLATFTVPAFAASTKVGVSPAETLERLDMITESIGERLVTFLGEDFIEAYYSDEDYDSSDDGPDLESIAYWMEVYGLLYEEAALDLDGFVDADEDRNFSEKDPATGETYFSKASLDHFIFGGSSEEDGAKAEVKGVYQRKDGRFNVDYFSDLYFKDKSMRAVQTLDYAAGKDYLFVQYAFYDDYYDDLGAHCYDVLRVMVSGKCLYMSIGVFTEAELNNNRVRSVYSDWDAFKLPDSDLFEFNGKTVRIVEEGEELVIGPDGKAA